MFIYIILYINMFYCLITNFFSTVQFYRLSYWINKHIYIC